VWQFGATLLAALYELRITFDDLGVVERIEGPDRQSSAATRTTHTSAARRHHLSSA